MKKNILVLSLALLSFGAVSTNTQAADIVDEENYKAVGQVTWHKEAEINPEEILQSPIPEQGTSLFFIRPSDNDPIDTSVNIAVNDRFLSSLQPGNYTHVYSCSGTNVISGEITGLKTNDLMQNTKSYNLLPNGSYFFYIDVDDNGITTVNQITDQSGLDALQDKQYQAHQINRVIPNCPVAPEQPAPPPVLEERVSIELEVLFDNDKSVIKPEYYIEVQEVADFMNEYSNTTAVIEGHTDSNASDAYNQDLSERRANAVRDMLINRFGIHADRLTAIGYGELRPRAPNATAEGRQLNRRVVAQIEEIKK